MANLTAPITVGTASANAVHAADLGKITWLNGAAYRVCKNTTLLALAASKGLVTAFTAGVPTWNVDLAGAGGYTDFGLVFVPAGQVGSSNTTSLLAGDYFMGQVSGPATFLAANTTMVKVAGQSLSVSSLGLVSAIAVVTTASTVAVPNSSIQATNTAGAAATGAAITGFIAGLI